MDLFSTNYSKFSEKTLKMMMSEIDVSQDNFYNILKNNFKLVKNNKQLTEDYCQYIITSIEKYLIDIYKTIDIGLEDNAKIESIINYVKQTIVLNQKFKKLIDDEDIPNEIRELVKKHLFGFYNNTKILCVWYFSQAELDLEITHHVTHFTKMTEYLNDININKEKLFYDFVHKFIINKDETKKLEFMYSSRNDDIVTILTLIIKCMPIVNRHSETFNNFQQAILKILHTKLFFNESYTIIDLLEHKNWIINKKFRIYEYQILLDAIYYNTLTNNTRHISCWDELSDIGQYDKTQFFMIDKTIFEWLFGIQF